MKYERMMYTHDQRSWVRAANEAIPRLEASAIRKQQRAAEIFRDWQSMSPSMRSQYASMFSRALDELYSEARHDLFQLLFYRGMKQANMPLEVDK